MYGVKTRLKQLYFSKNEEEKTKYRKNHPELGEILTTIYDIERDAKFKKSQDFRKQIEQELKSAVAKHVSSNQEIRAELAQRQKEFVKTQDENEQEGVEVKDD